MASRLGGAGQSTIDKVARYERVAQAMALAKQAGLRKIGFITEPVH